MRVQTRAIKFRHRRIWHSSCPASEPPRQRGGGPMLLRMVLWLCCISAGLAPQASRQHVEPRASRAEAATSGYSARTARSSRHESCCPEPGLAASRLLVRAHFAESAGHIRRRGSPRTGSNVYEAPAKLSKQKMSRAHLHGPHRGGAQGRSLARTKARSAGTTVSKWQRKAT